MPRQTHPQRVPDTDTQPPTYDASIIDTQQSKRKSKIDVSHVQVAIQPNGVDDADILFKGALTRAYAFLMEFTKRTPDKNRDRVLMTVEHPDLYSRSGSFSTDWHSMASALDGFHEDWDVVEQSADKVGFAHTAFNIKFTFILDPELKVTNRTRASHGTVEGVKRKHAELYTRYAFNDYFCKTKALLKIPDNSSGYCFPMAILKSQVCTIPSLFLHSSFLFRLSFFSTCRFDE